MPQDAIFLPMGALALLTFLVLTLIPIRRFGAAFAGKVTPADFKLGESPQVPAHVALPNRNYMNLLELPLLFYVVCLMLHATGRVDQVFLSLAWTYVALRALHSAIHLTVNNLALRPAVFALSNLVLIAMWALFYWPLIE
jgi:hypothetical protein